MPRPASSSADPSKPWPVSPRQSPVGPLFVWVFLQLSALAISIARIPFFATKSFPNTPETIALAVMLVFQIGGSALLFPFLLRDARAAAMVIAASWPFTVLAGFLAAQSDHRKIIAAAIYVSVWLIGLALWSQALRTHRGKGIGVAVAILVALGGPLAWFLTAEYGVTGNAGWGAVSGWGPILAAMAVTERDPMHRQSWVLLVAHLAAAVVGWTISLQILRRKPLPVFTLEDPRATN
jgi:hypothetical protein